MTTRIARVTIDELPEYECYLNDAEEWNGWLVPYMTLEQVRTLSESIGRGDWGEDASVNFEIDENGKVWHVDNSEEDICRREILPIEITVDRKIITVYPVSEGMCWEDIDTPVS